MGQSPHQLLPVEDVNQPVHRDDSDPGPGPPLAHRDLLLPRYPRFPTEVTFLTMEWGG